MLNIIKRMLCKHKHEFKRLPSPFYGYPVYDKEGFWIKDKYAHVCIKCNNITWLDYICEKDK